MNKLFDAIEPVVIDNELLYKAIEEESRDKENVELHELTVLKLSYKSRCALGVCTSLTCFLQKFEQLTI